MCWRMRTSSWRKSAKSLLPVYQFDFQSWMTPTRIPPGWIFWPIYESEEVCDSFGVSFRVLGALRVYPVEGFDFARAPFCAFGFASADSGSEVGPVFSSAGKAAGGVGAGLGASTPG